VTEAVVTWEENKTTPVFLFRIWTLTLAMILLSVTVPSTFRFDPFKTIWPEVGRVISMVVGCGVVPPLSESLLHEKSNIVKQERKKILVFINSNIAYQRSKIEPMSFKPSL
jgi:hypothetical protein